MWRILKALPLHRISKTSLCPLHFTSVMTWDAGRCRSWALKYHMKWWQKILGSQVDLISGDICLCLLTPLRLFSFACRHASSLCLDSVWGSPRDWISFIIALGTNCRHLLICITWSSPEFLSLIFIPACSILLRVRHTRGVVLAVARAMVNLYVHWWTLVNIFQVVFE